jgi:hypothetical protein
MNGPVPKTTGWLAILTGIFGFLTLMTLILFFVGLFQDIASLSVMGALNDTLNALTGILGAALASVLYPVLRRFAPRLSPFLLIGVWTGALAIAFGSWLIQTGRSDVELSSYYYFFGNGLIGLWLWVLNRAARVQTSWPRNLTQFGSIASLFMMLGLLALYGILLGLDGSDYSPLLMVTGLSFLGIGILYPVWCLRLGRWILSRQADKVMAV